MPVPAAPVASVPVPVDLRAEFGASHLRYRQYCKNIKWHEVFPELGIPDRPDLLADLMAVGIGKIILRTIEIDKSRELFGYLPYMCTGSSASISKLLTQSFAERVNSAGNLVVSKGNTLLADDEVDMLVTLRMNREFMIYMRKNYPRVSRQDFKMAVLTELQNREE